MTETNKCDIIVPELILSDNNYLKRGLLAYITETDLKEMPRWAFDIEVFKNFFCVTFMRLEDGETQVFTIWDKNDDSFKLKKFLAQPLFLIGFNNLSYDMPVLRYILNYRGKTLNSDLYKLSAKLISDAHRDDEDIMALRYPRYQETIVNQDLMALMGFMRTGVGLKQCSINLRWHRVQDLPLHYTHVVTDKDVPEIIDYNINDTRITIALYNDKSVSEARFLREQVALQFGTGILSAADSKIANIILEDLYEEATGIPKKVFKEQRTQRPEICFHDVILPAIKFTSPKLQALLRDMKEVVVYPQERYKFEKSLFFSGNTYNMGVGGLHTDEKPAIFLETDTHKIMSMDVASYYPSIMCDYRIKPAHLEDVFIDILSNVKAERIQAKRSGNKTKAESYKIVINATFGKLGFNNYWLYDPMAMLQVTVNGQLFLLMLVERMEANGIHCISANTDGIELNVPRELESLAIDIARQWEKETKFELEFTYYSKYIKRDVNNYIAVTTDGKVKTKGVFNQDINLKKGYKYPIIPKAVNAYFLDGTPVEQTIRNCKDIFDFCISQKIGKEYGMEMVSLADKKTESHSAYTDTMKIAFLRANGWRNAWTNTNWVREKEDNDYAGSNLEEAFEICWQEKNFSERVIETQELQKTNRFFVSNGGGVLQKRDGRTKKTIGLMVGESVKVLNDYDSSVNFVDYNVNMEWYIRQAKDFIEEIEPVSKPMSMFADNTDFSAKRGSITETEVVIPKKKKKTTSEKDILESASTKRTFPVEKGYLLVKRVTVSQFKTKTATISVYSLAKGIEMNLKMTPAMFEATKISANDVILLKRTSKKPRKIAQGADWVVVPNEFNYYIESFELVKNIPLFIKQNRL